MKLYIERTNKEKEIEYEGTAKKLLQQLGINPETILIIQNGTLVTEETNIQNTDEIKLMTVVSGG